MAEKGPEDGMNEAPDFEETDGPEGKSKVSLLPKAFHRFSYPNQPLLVSFV